MTYRVYCGWDPRQLIAWAVLQNSIFRHTADIVSLAPISADTFPCKRRGLTGFTWTRFLVPWACGFQGWALFLDVDILVKCDIADVFKLADDRHAVMVRKGPLAYEYASVMLFNCAHPDNAKLTPEYVGSTKDGLHTISWTDAVGDLPAEYNLLVGYEPANPAAKIIHYTQGVPVWNETRGCDHANDWIEEAQIAFSAQPWHELMGGSKHAAHVYERLRKQAVGM